MSTKAPFPDADIPTADNWRTILGEANQGMYIVEKKMGESQGHTYEVCSKDQLKELGVRKLSVAEILTISSKVLKKKVASEKSPSLLDVTTTLSDITTKVSALREVRNRKRSQIGRQVRSGVEFVLSIALSVAGIGIYLLYKRHQANEDFARADANWSETIKQNNVPLEVKCFMALPEVTRKLKGGKDLSQEAIQQRLSSSLRDNINQMREPPQNNLFIFERDMKTDFSFKRIDTDKAQKINDKEAVPAAIDYNEIISFDDTTNAQNERVTKAAQSIDEIVQKETKWRDVLQFAVTQASINALFSPLTATFDQEMNPNTKSQWRIISELKKEPTELKVIRNRDGNITEIKVTISGDVDVLKKDITQDEKGEMIKENAFTGKLSYSITLDDNNQPQFSNIEAGITYNK